MEKIEIPGYGVINLPDDINVEERNQIAADIQKDFGIDINKTSVLEDAKEYGKGFVRSALDTTLRSGVGLAAAIDIGNDGKPVTKLQNWRKTLREDSPLAASRKYDDSYAMKLSEGFGSFAPYFGVGAIARAQMLRKGAPIPSVLSKEFYKSPMFTTPVMFAAPGATSEQVDRMEMSRAMGEDVGPVSEILAELTGGAIGITEVLPIANIFRRTSKTALKDYGIRDKIKSALTATGQEGLQEVTASLAQDLTARGFYSDELPIGDSLLDEFTVGGIVGGTVDLVLNSVAGKRGIANQSFLQQEEKLRENRKKLQSDLLFQKAYAQGTVEDIQQPQFKEKPISDDPPISEIVPLPNFEIIQDTQGKFNLLDTSQEGSPVIETFDGIANAQVAKDKKLNELRVKNLEIDIKNALYNQGLIKSSSAFDLGLVLSDPNSIEFAPQSIINFDSRVKNIDKKNIEKYFKNKKLELKPTYNMQEIRKILAPKDLNKLQSDLAQQIFRASEQQGEPSIRDDKSQINVNNKYIKEIAASKNIELDFKDPAVQYFTRQVTGYDDISKVKNRGAKELFLARLHSLPKFNFKTKLPDFRPREYSAEDMANFVANMGANNLSFTVADLLKAGPTAGNKPATEQFVRDLNTSGRATKVEGTNKYKINPNYEFEVARKQEGFNETPDEFRARLLQENQLPQEAIDKLYEEEKLRQDRFLPPQEVEPKIINFAQSIDLGRTNKFALEAKKMLDGVGLKETGVVISDEILSTTGLIETPEGVVVRNPRKYKDEEGFAAGEYDVNTDTIFISLNAVNPDGLATDAEIKERINRIMDHELIHALRAKDLITEKEYQYLRKEVKRAKVPSSIYGTALDPMAKFGETYYARAIRINTQITESLAGKDLKEEKYVEEAIAEYYRTRNIEQDLPLKAEKIYDKFVQFYKSMGQAFRRAGYTNTSQIFQDIESGKVGTRQRDEIRTLREFDTLSLRDELAPVVPIDTTRPKTPYTTIGIDEEGNEVIITTTPVEQFPGTVPLKPLKGVTLRPRAGVGGPDTTPVGEVYDVRKLTPEEYDDTKKYLLENYKRIYKNVPRGVSKDGRKFLAWMKDNAPNEDYKIIASKVLETLNKLANAGVQTFIDIKSLERGVRGQNAYDMAAKTNTVTVSNRRDIGAFDDGVNYETILHEFIHSATVPIIYQRKGALKGFSKKAEKLFKNLEELQELTARSIVERIDELEASLIKAVSDESTLATEVTKIVESVANRPNFEREYVNKLTERLTRAGRIDLQERNQLIKDYTIGYKQGSFAHLIGYQTFGLQRPKTGQSLEQYQKNKKADIAEFLTFGLTNRDYQEILESISYVPKKQSAWSKFVDSIREFLGLPVKANTALSGFLENASSLIDIAATQAGEIAFGDIGEVITRSDRQSLDDEINKLGTQIYNLERRAEADRQYLSNDAYNQDMRRIGNLKARQEDLIRQRAELPPEQPPLFSRVSDIENKYANENIKLNIFETENEIKLSKIVVSEKNMGLGTSVMNDLTNYADNNNKVITLTPSKDFGATSVNRLKTFYKRFGFVENKGRNKDFSYRDTMYRLPQISQDIPTFSRAQDIGSPLDTQEDVPLFSRSARFAKDKNTSENKKLVEATERAEEMFKTTPNGEIPTINLSASDVAIKSFIDFNDINNTSTPPDDIPNFSVAKIPDDFIDLKDRIGYVEPRKSFGARMIDYVSDPITSIKETFKTFRADYIDSLDLTVKGTERQKQENEEIRLLENNVVTSAISALRMTDKGRGIFQQMLLRGYVTDAIEGEAALPVVEELELSTVYNPYFEGDTGVGGLMQLWAPLYADPAIDRQFIFKLYAVSKRTEGLNNKGQLVESPISRVEARANIQKIENEYPEVVEVYNNYQNWNNKLIDFARSKGLLDPEQAKLWKENSFYYPFYKVMADEKLGGPRIAAGALPNNPLSIKLTGSEKPLDVDPLEAISRNSLSILTAALKNDGTQKLLRNLELNGEAKQILDPKQVKKARAEGKEVIFAFVDGQKQFYEVLDPQMFYGLQSIGGTDMGMLGKIMGYPASLLRDLVTRDPGFVVVNVLRDTLSAAVTSGAPLYGDGFTPVIDSFKNLFADMQELEKFGVIGGYDFQNDEGSVKQFTDRAMRKAGMRPDNSQNAENLFFKLWDGLGALTTKSDGATRLSVYHSVYNDLKKRGYSEAQAQSEAAYQALEIINFGRRGLSPIFRIITAAIPFFNARIQGLDVLFRTFTGQYSAIDKLEAGQTQKDLKNIIKRRALLRGFMLMFLTAIYYMLVSDDEEYKGMRREVRDDNWIVPLPSGLPALKIPVPFEVGMIFKTFPERFIDEFFGKQIEKEPLESVKRQLKTTTALPILQPAFGFQAFKPLAEAYIFNKNSYTGTEIVPYYQQNLDARYQSRFGTNDFIKNVGETFNISPLKLEHMLRGYTGTLGGYVLDVADAVSRGATGEPIIPPRLDDIPVLRRILYDYDRSGGGLQQQFYELRDEVQGAIQTMNRLREDGRFDEYSAYRSNIQGRLNVRGQVNAISRYMDNWRKRRDNLLKRTDVSASAKTELLEQLELERDRRLAIVPELRDRMNLKVASN